MPEENIRYWVIVAAVFLVLVIPLIGINYGADRYKCATVAKELEREYKISTVYGCLIKTKDGYVPLSQMRFQP
jgi:hypothetical protein